MKQLFQVASWAYVIFALLAFSNAVDSIEEPTQRNAAEGRVVDPSRPALHNNQRLYLGNARADFRVEKWGATWCPACRRWNQEELPALLKAGYQTVTKDIDKEDPPTHFKTIPHVIIYFKDKIIHEGGYMTAGEIIEVIEKYEPDYVFSGGGGTGHSN